MEGICCVDSCDRKQNCDKSVLFHQFPKKGALKRTWLESIPMKKDIPRTLLVCSDHFLESDYKHVRGKKILNLDNTPTVFTKIFKDPDKNGDDKIIETVDEVLLKRKSKKHGDTTPTKLMNPDRNDDDKLIESDDEVPLKMKTRKHGDNSPTFTKISKDPDKNYNDKVIGSDDEVPLVRKSKRHVDHTFTKLSKDPDNNDCNKQQEAEAHLKRKTRKRVIKVKKNSSVVKPSDSVKKDKSNSINETNDKSVVNNQSNSNDNRISEELTKNVNMEMNKRDFSEFDQKLDLEDNIPSFIIKDNKPRQIEINVPPCEVEVEVIPETTEVVNIEVAVDPSLLMMDEPSVVEEIELSDDSDIEITPIEKICPPTDPVSLLTSSDEDEVVYLEPKYDMVEVSDETDEDDRPLIRFINKKLNKKLEYICSSCNYTGDTHPKYVRHLRKHSIFLCSICSQTSKTKEQLSNHMRKHGLEKKYKCHLCSYKAKYQMSLILHVSTHKTYLRCKACPFMTMDRNILSRHRETHLQNNC